jgi:hypothetical protein
VATIIVYCNDKQIYFYKSLHLHFFYCDIDEDLKTEFIMKFKKSSMIFLPCAISQFVIDQSFNGFSFPSN